MLLNNMSRPCNNMTFPLNLEHNGEFALNFTYYNISYVNVNPVCIFKMMMILSTIYRINIIYYIFTHIIGIYVFRNVFVDWEACKFKQIFKSFLKFLGMIFVIAIFRTFYLHGFYDHQFQKDNMCHFEQASAISSYYCNDFAQYRD